jgi:hypothetical protein
MDHYKGRTGDTMSDIPFEEYAHMTEEEILEMIKGWPVTDHETGITYANLREFAEKTGKVDISNEAA